MVLSVGRQTPDIPPVTQGTIVQLSTATWPELKGVTTAIGGGPAILRNGKVIDRSDANVRHPRTAVGWNKDYFYLVEVDGRQRGLSVGMTLRELAEYLVKIGCTDAMNLDGGGSATCWVYGQVMNSPSEGEERGMGNSLVIIQKKD
jgi:exopolysaccharide biosynthesis protein